MPITLQDVLALLPELFPGVQKIPLANIRLNPENPGPQPTEDQIAELAANIAAIGLQNPIKVMPDPAGPLAPGVAFHPDNPRLAVSTVEPLTRPWTVSDFRYINLSGELRQLAHERLQWAEIQATILNPTEEEAVIITRLDNTVRSKGWWADYQSLESLIKRNPTLTQREITTRLRMDLEKVNRALRLLPLLNPEARELIVRNTNNSNNGNKGISEIAASRLAGLSPQTAFKPGVKRADEAQRLYPYAPVPPETQDLVCRALKEAIDQQMTETQVKGLVAHLLAGGEPDGYNSKAPASTPAKPVSHIPQPPAEEQASKAPSPEPIQPSSPTHPKTHSPASPKADSDASQKPSLALEALAGISVIGTLKSKLKKGEKLTGTETLMLVGYRLWQVVAWIDKQVFKVLKSLIKEMWKLSKDSLRLLGRKVFTFVAGVLTIVLICALLWAGWMIYFHGTGYTEHWLLSRIHLTHAATPQSTAVPTPIPTLTTPPPTAVPTAVPPTPTTVPVTLKVKKHSKRVVEKTAPAIAPAVSMNTPVPTVSTASVAMTPTTLTPVAPTPSPKPDVIGQAAKQVAPDLAVGAVKKIFNF